MKKFILYFILYFFFLMFIFFGIKFVIKKSYLIKQHTKYKFFDNYKFIDAQTIKNNLVNGDEKDKNILITLNENIEKLFFKSTQEMNKLNIKEHVINSSEIVNLCKYVIGDNVSYKNKLMSTSDILHHCCDDICDYLKNKYKDFDFHFNTYYDMIVKLNTDINENNDVIKDEETNNTVLQCDVCKSNKKKIAINCGHIFCNSCIQLCDNCPLCSKLITHELTVYI